MKNIISTIAVLLLLTVAVSAKKHPDIEDFNLTAHITSIQSAHGYQSSGSLSISTDDDGKVSGRGDSGGESYSYLVYTVTIDGTPITYQMGNAYAMRGMRHTTELHLGDYKGALEEQRHDVRTTPQRQTRECKCRIFPYASRW